MRYQETPRTHTRREILGKGVMSLGGLIIGGGLWNISVAADELKKAEKEVIQDNPVPSPTQLKDALDKLAGEDNLSQEQIKDNLAVIAQPIVNEQVMIKKTSKPSAELIGGLVIASAGALIFSAGYGIHGASGNEKDC